MNLKVFKNIYIFTFIILFNNIQCTISKTFWVLANHFDELIKKYLDSEHFVWDTLIDLQRAFDAVNRRWYCVSKKLVKRTWFQGFPLQLSGYHDLPPLSFELSFECWVINLIGCSSVQDQLKTAPQWKLNTLNTDSQSVLQNINKFAAGQTRPILTNTRSSRSHAFCYEFCGIF